MPDRKAQAHDLSEALALVGLFSDCIEAISLIHGIHEGQHNEELLMSQLEIQKSRLLIWGDIVGISSPPASTGITQAVPLHPGAFNPEPDWPVNFGPRDPRLEDRQTRRIIEDALDGINDPIKHTNRSVMLQTYGLQHDTPPTKTGHSTTAAGTVTDPEGARDFRLEAFREKHTLLRDSWSIAQPEKFTSLLTLIRENIDYLIKLMDVQPRVDKAMKLDIRAMGWHPSEDIVRISQNTMKLSLLNQAAEEEYPEYSDAAQEALDNIMDQWKGTEGYAPRPDHLNPRIEKAVLHSPSHSRAASPERGGKGKGLLGIRPKLMRLFSGGGGHGHGHGRAGSGGRRSDPSTPTRPSGPARSNSEWASPVTGSDGIEALDPPRSQSIHGDNDLERTKTYESLNHVLSHTETLSSQISRHDMFPGIFRVQTKPTRGKGRDKK